MGQFNTFGHEMVKMLCIIVYRLGVGKGGGQQMAPFPSSSLSSFNPKEGGVAPSGGVKNLILFKNCSYQLYLAPNQLFAFKIN